MSDPPSSRSDLAAIYRLAGDITVVETELFFGPILNMKRAAGWLGYKDPPIWYAGTEYGDYEERYLKKLGLTTNQEFYDWEKKHFPRGPNPKADRRLIRETVRTFYDLADELSPAPPDPTHSPVNVGLRVALRKAKARTEMKLDILTFKLRIEFNELEYLYAKE